MALVWELTDLVTAAAAVYVAAIAAATTVAMNGFIVPVPCVEPGMGNNILSANHIAIF